MTSLHEGTIRLNRYLAQCGLGSRRECDRLIAAGSIIVNGARVRELGVKINPARDLVSCRGKNLCRVLPLQYIAYHKPSGILVTADDPQGRVTIYDALAKQGLDCRHLKYVGRLDRNSEGLLLMTNDGELVHALTHPRFGIKKTYAVRIDRPLDEQDIVRMTIDGISSEGQTLRAGKMVRMTGAKDGGYWYTMDLFEGKKRQIRRMMAAGGYEVLRLIRTQFGVVKLNGLPCGQYRELTPREVKGLLNLGFEGRHPSARG